MTRFVFVSLPLVGHLDWGGMLPTAVQLRTRGHAVAWASEVAVRDLVIQQDIEFLALRHSGWRLPPPLPPDLSVAQQARLRRLRALDSWLHPDSVTQATAELSDLLQGWQAEVVVAEPYAAAAALVAERLKLPLIVCGRPALAGGAPKHPHPAAARIQQLCQQARVPGRYWDLTHCQMRSPWLHVDFFSRRWYADLSHIGQQTRFVGGQAQMAPARADHQTSTVLITLGSLFRHDPVFFRTAAEAVMLEGGRPLVVSGVRADRGQADTLQAVLPHGTQVVGWVDFDQVLPQVAAIIHHGGVATTHAALCHGLPQVAVPHAGDQRPQAGRITRAGVGYGVRPRDFTLANARWLVHQVLGNKELSLRAAAWQDELQRLGGIEAAAEAMEAIGR